MDKEKLEAMLTAIGAMSELIWVMYLRFRDQGFSESQAMYLVGKATQSMLTKGETTDEEYPDI